MFFLSTGPERLIKSDPTYGMKSHFCKWTYFSQTCMLHASTWLIENFDFKNFDDKYSDDFRNFSKIDTIFLGYYDSPSSNIFCCGERPYLMKGSIF